MSTSAGTVSRHARRFVAVALVALVCWQAGVVLGFSRRYEVALGLYGFVFHAIFGKAYSLVPAYFDRDLVDPRPALVHLPLTAVGAALLAVAALGGPDWAAPTGAGAWTLGVLVFVGTLAWTVRDNLTGVDTGTSPSKADRRRVDRLSNLLVPVAFTYLLVGAFLRTAVALRVVRTVPVPATTHLLAAGTAALMVFAIGFRLFPRFAVATPPFPLVVIVLASGAVGPALLALGLTGRTWALHAGAAFESIAVVGYAVAITVLLARSDRDRIGLRLLSVAVWFGAVGVLVGAGVVVGDVSYGLIPAHLRVNLLGFLGLTIVGAFYQFYPPAVGTFPGASDRGGLVAAGLLGLGVTWTLVAVTLRSGGSLPGGTAVVRVGGALSLLGALGVAWIILGLFYERHWSR